MGRWDDNTGHGRATFMFEADFSPTTIGEESDSGGWLRTTAPEGTEAAGLAGLATLHTAGSRGKEGKNVKSTTKPRPKGTAGNGA